MDSNDTSPFVDNLFTQLILTAEPTDMTIGRVRSVGTVVVLVLTSQSARVDECPQRHDGSRPHLLLGVREQCFQFIRSVSFLLGTYLGQR